MYVFYTIFLQIFALKFDGGFNSNRNKQRFQDLKLWTPAILQEP